MVAAKKTVVGLQVSNLVGITLDGQVGLQAGSGRECEAYAAQPWSGVAEVLCIY